MKLAKQWFSVILFTFILMGCDGSLAVTGQIENARFTGSDKCQLSLWSMRGPIWGKDKPKKLRETTIVKKFDFHWTISGPVSNHWIEISCPGYKLFRTEEFEAPSTQRKKSLGKIKLIPKKL